MRRFLARLLRRMAYAVDPPAPLLQPASGAEIDGIKHDLLMPKYLYTSPLDYDLESHPPKYDPPVFLPGEELPIPPLGVVPAIRLMTTRFICSGERTITISSSR